MPHIYMLLVITIIYIIAIINIIFMQHYSLKVPENLAGIRLDKAASSLCEFSRSRVQQLIKSGDVEVNGNIVKDADLLVTAEDEIMMIVPPPIDTTMRPCDIELNIVYEDDHLLVIDKQAGLTVHPGAGQHGDTLANALLSHCGDSLSGIGGVSRPGIVHRLDRDTSGLMVVAKNDLAHVSLAEQIANRHLKRVYNAIIWGFITPPLGTITTNLDRSRRDRTMIQVVRSGGKIATTHYRTLEIHSHTSLVECRLDTGRTHQIRVHMSHLGHSVFGDPVYGSHGRKLRQYYGEIEDLAGFKRQALHSCYIEFTHPATHEVMSFASEFPEDISELLAILQK